jgi:hypothetical protein
MQPASRTPEGWSNHCPVCGHDVTVDPTIPPGDAPCPCCGSLLWFSENPRSHVSPESIERTKQQIRGLVGEITQLSQSDLDESEFWPAFLQRVVQALAAVGGALWVLGEDSKPQLSYQINLSEKLLDEESEDAIRHFRLLDYIIQSKTGQLVPPLSSVGDERMGGNPTLQLLVIGPVGRGGRVQAVVEIFQRAGTMPATQRGYLEFLKQMCKLGSDFLDRKLMHHVQHKNKVLPRLEWVAMRLESFFAWIGRLVRPRKPLPVKGWID